MRPEDHFEGASEGAAPAPFRGEYCKREARRRHDHLHVDLSQGWEVHLWTRHFGCSEAELRQAVRAVGNEVIEVGAYLRRRG